MLYVEHTRNWPFTYVQSGAHRFLFVTCAQPAGCGEPGHTHAFDAPVYVFVAANPFGQTTPASVHFVRSVDVLIEIPTAVAACAGGSIPLLGKTTSARRTEEPVLARAVLADRRVVHYREGVLRGVSTGKRGVADLRCHR
jgi:hypothetical protein